MHLLEALENNRDSDIYPLHMPGHKRNCALLSMANPYGLDITEVEGFDDLHDAKGILAEGMARGAKLYGSDRAFDLINGSTCGILAAIAAATKKGDRVLVARNCHKSVYNAIALRDLEPRYLMPAYEGSFGIAGSIVPAEVAAALERYPDTRLIVITSPTYEGVLSDVAAIADLAHQKGIPLMVDEAHGAHLGFAAGFPGNAVQAGADLVIHSLHKTLPSLNQTGLLHLTGNLVDGREVEKQLAVYETSSPSYVLMASIDVCLDLLASRGESLFAQYQEILGNFYGAMGALQKLRLFARHSAGAAVFDSDPGKILISVKGTNLTGPALKKLLLSRYQIQLEMALGDYALGMTSIFDRKVGFDRLGRALLEIDESLTLSPEEKGATFPLHYPIVEMSVSQAEAAEGRMVPLESGIGAVSQEYVYAYPPGIPLLTPGERISAEILDIFADLICRGVALKSTYGHMPQKIQVVRAGLY